VARHFLFSRHLNKKRERKTAPASIHQSDSTGHHNLENNRAVVVVVVLEKKNYKITFDQTPFLLYQSTVRRRRVPKSMKKTAILP